MRSRTWLWTTLLGVLLARAQPAIAEPEGTGFELGLRTGYGAPIGKLGASVDLSSPIGGEIPVSVDLGSRVLPELFIGVYAQYGFGFDGSGVYVSPNDARAFRGTVENALACGAPGVRCRESDIRLGLEVIYHPLPRNLLDPWFGLGFGYEWLNLTAEKGSAQVSLSPHGIEPIHAQSGLDFALAPHWRLGPFVALTFAQFRRAPIECKGVNDCIELGLDGRVPNGNRKHAWFLFGVHGAYAP